MPADHDYTFVIITEKPNERFTRRIPFNWHPSTSDMFESIARMKREAEQQGVTDVRVKSTYLRQVTTIEHNCVDLDEVNLPSVRVSSVSQHRCEN